MGDERTAPLRGVSLMVCTGARWSAVVGRPGAKVGKRRRLHFELGAWTAYDENDGASGRRRRTASPGAPGSPTGALGQTNRGDAS